MSYRSMFTSDQQSAFALSLSLCCFMTSTTLCAWGIGQSLAYHKSKLSCDGLSTDETLVPYYGCCMLLCVVGETAFASVSAPWLTCGEKVQQELHGVGNVKIHDCHRSLYGDFHYGSRIQMTPCNAAAPSFSASGTACTMIRPHLLN